MATETLRPNGEFSDVGLVANSELDHDEDPDSISATVNATSNNVHTEWGGDFPTPTGNPTVGADLQEFRVGVIEFDSGQSGTPDARIELWENGTLVRAGSNVPVSVYAVLSFKWNANELATADGSLVQCKLIGTKSGGSPGSRNTTRIGHMEWNADYTVGGATDDLLADDVESLSEVTAPVLGQVHSLLATDVQSTSEVSSPAIGQTHTLGAIDVQSVSEVSSPVLGQVHVLLADDVESISEVSAPVLGEPSEGGKMIGMSHSVGGFVFSRIFSRVN